MCAYLSLIWCLFAVLFFKSLSLPLSMLCGVTVEMSPMDLVIYFKEEKHNVGLIHPKDCIVDRIRVDALKITGVYRLNKVEKILLNFINPRNKSGLC